VNLAAAWEWLSGSPLFGITVTLAAFLLAHRLWERTGRHPSLNPLLVSMMLVAGVIVALRVPYERYAESAGIVTFLLGPATVALALPLHREAARVREAAPMVLGAVVLGSVVALASGYLFTRWAGGDEVLALSMAPKSTTTPISLALGAQVGGVPALSALFTVVAGIIGAVSARGC